jgi:hypothetical protein
MNLDKLPTIDWDEVQRSARRVAYDPHTYKRISLFVVGALLLVCLWSACSPLVVPAPPAPTVTATATPFVSTHVPTRTITPTFTRTATWTNTPTPTMTLTLQPTRTDTPGSTSTAEPTDTSTPIPAGRDLTKIPGTLTPLLPNLGLSAQQIQELTPTVTGTPERELSPTPTPTPKRITLPEGCVFHSWYAEFGSEFDVMTFRCPTLFGYGQGVGASD